MNRISRLIPLLVAFGLVAAVAGASCARVPLLAPSGTVINLTVASDTASVNSSINLIAVLIENGQQSGGTGTGTASTTTTTTGAGTPVQDGTVVSFTTSIGTIEPAEAKTVNGRVNAVLKTTSESGTATITAYSGGAKSTAQIKIGAANAKTVTVTASPQNLPASGGTTTVSARVDDVNGNGVAGTPVTFSTTKGTLSSATATTNTSGVASVTLTTTSAADVTATVAGISNKATIGVSASATVSITGPSTTVSVATPAAFTINVGTAVPVKDVTVTWGDGQSRNLGVVSGSSSLTHSYSSAGTYDVSLSATDSDGLISTGRTQVVVTSLNLTVTASSSTVTRGVPVTFTASVTPSTASIDHYTYDFGDGTSQDSGATTTHVYSTSAPSGVLNVFVRAFTTSGGSVSGSTQIVIAASTGSINISGLATSAAYSNPVSFSVDTNSTPLTNVTVDYGDGSATRSLGSYTGTRSDSHVYSTVSSSTGFIVSASGTNSDGKTVTTTASIVIFRPSVTITVNAAGSFSTLTPTSLTATVTPNTTLVDHYEWSFSDGGTATTPGPSVTHQFLSSGARTATVTVVPVAGASFSFTVNFTVG